jgi:hypothetical protein
VHLRVTEAVKLSFSCLHCVHCVTHQLLTGRDCPQYLEARMRRAVRERSVFAMLDKQCTWQAETAQVLAAQALLCTAAAPSQRPTARALATTLSDLATRQQPLSASTAAVAAAASAAAAATYSTAAASTVRTTGRGVWCLVCMEETPSSYRCIPCRCLVCCESCAESLIMMSTAVLEHGCPRCHRSATGLEPSRGPEPHDV